VVASLIVSLCQPSCYPHPVEQVEVLETHISWVLLAGDYAYKIKKPVDFGFLDFTRLEQRHFFCDEEIRLNGRFGSGLYLDVVPIGGSLENPILGQQPAIEYAVRMRRFASRDLLDNCLLAGRLSHRHIDHLAHAMAEFHQALPAEDSPLAFGSAEAVIQPVRDNIRQLSPLLDENARTLLNAIATASEREWQRCRAAIDRRRNQGRVRECHGDLHLGNIVLIGDQPCPFDGIEFNDALRWIDVISDIAFLLMDLRHCQRRDLAYRFLNTYLEVTGDYDGVTLLGFYQAYRAMVKAKIVALRAAQNGAVAWHDQCRAYMALALDLLHPGQPALLVTHGLPGCGKTVVSRCIAEKLPAIHLRSDVERKRLFGLKATDRAQDGQALYTAYATAKTYQCLAQLSKTLLAQGCKVIVDAAFLRRRERDAFACLAREQGVPLVIVDITSNDAVQRQRLQNRRNDASDADESVLDHLQRQAEPLADDERQYAVSINNDRDGVESLLVADDWQRLRQRLG